MDRKDDKGRTLHTGETQAKDGRYIFSYMDVSGRRCKAYSWRLLPSDRQQRGKKKELSLREKEAEIQESLNKGISIDGKRKTVSELCEEYVKIVSPRRRENTKAVYRTTLAFLKDNAFGHRKVADITMSEAKSFIVNLQQNDGMSYSSIQNIRGMLKPAFEMAVDDDLVRRNPFNFELKQIVVNDSKRREALTADEMNMFLSWVHEHEHYRMYYPAFYLQFFTGMRISEMCGLTESDINFEKHYLKVQRQLLRTRHGELYLEAPKTASGSRIIPLTYNTEEALREILAARPDMKGKEPVLREWDDSRDVTGFLFYDKDNHLTVAQHWENHYRYASGAFRKEHPDFKKKISSHVARHTYCSLRVREGIHVKTLQKVMGHSSIRTTLGWYTHVSDTDVMTETLQLMDSDKELCRFITDLSQDSCKNSADK